MDVELWQQTRTRMGQHQTVYTGKLKGLQLALATLHATQTADRPLVALLSLNNTSALTHATDPAPLSAQHLRLTIRQAFENLERTKKDITVHLLWLPGHVGIAGNKAADVEVKEAVRDQESAALERERERATRTHAPKGSHSLCASHGRAQRRLQRRGLQVGGGEAASPLPRQVGRPQASPSHWLPRSRRQCWLSCHGLSAKARPQARHHSAVERRVGGAISRSPVCPRRQGRLDCPPVL